MKAYAMWTLDNGQYRGVVISTKTFDTIARTPETYRSCEEAVRGARAMLDAMEAKA